MRNLIIKIIIYSLISICLCVFVIFQLTTSLEYNTKYFNHNTTIIFYGNGKFEYVNGNSSYRTGDFKVNKNEKSIVLTLKDGTHFGEVEIESKDRIHLSIIGVDPFPLVSSIHYKYYIYYKQIYTIFSLVILGFIYMSVKNIKLLMNKKY